MRTGNYQSQSGVPFWIKAVLVLVAFFYIGRYASVYYVQAHSELAQSAKRGEVINILFLGIDAREREENSRSDTMMLFSLDPEKGRAALLSIPRDTNVKDARGHLQRINALNYLEGPEGACAGAAELLNVKIPYYVLTNFEGFVNIIDILGGLDLDVDMPMQHSDPVNPHLAINLAKGLQHLNGDQALQYVRFRGDPTADIGRTKRQQKFLQALAEQTLQGSTIVKLPSLVKELLANVQTNLSIHDIIFIGGMLTDFDSSQLVSQTLPGYPYTDPKSGASYWHADEDLSSHIIKDILDGKQYDTYQPKPKK